MYRRVTSARSLNYICLYGKPPRPTRQLYQRIEILPYVHMSSQMNKHVYLP